MEPAALAAICRNHVEGPQRRAPHALSVCRSCGQTWPCDAALVASELALTDVEFVPLPAAARVLVRVAPGRVTRDTAALMKSLLDGRCPDVDWLIVEADEIAADLSPPIGGMSDARCTEEDAAPQADQEGREEDSRPEAP